MRILFLAGVTGILACSDTAFESVSHGHEGSGVYFEGPVPRLAAFLAPLSEPGYEAAVIIVTNAAPVPTRMLFGACSFGLRLYSNAALRGAPAWETRHDGCEAALHFMDVPSQQSRSRQVGAYFSRSDIQASLAPGEYHAAVAWQDRRTERVHLVAAGRVRVH